MRPRCWDWENWENWETGFERVNIGARDVDHVPLNFSLSKASTPRRAMLGPTRRSTLHAATGIYGGQVTLLFLLVWLVVQPPLAELREY